MLDEVNISFVYSTAVLTAFPHKRAPPRFFFPFFPPLTAKQLPFFSSELGVARQGLDHHFLKIMR